MKIQHFNQTRNEIILEILNEFNFNKCLEVMNFLNWTWVKEVLNIDLLKKISKEYLEDVWKKLHRVKEGYISISSGGIKASGSWDQENNKVCWLQLEFILENSYYENENS